MNDRVLTRLFSPGLLLIVLAALAISASAHATQVTLVGDASVSTARPSTNFGTLSNLYVGNGNTAFLQFDLSTLPAGLTSSQISHATLTIFVNRVNAAGSVTLSPVTSAWTETSVTSATAPSIGAATGTFIASTVGQYVTFDVTSVVQGWLTTPATNLGFALASGSANVLLDSKENDETAHPASLDITITSTGATGPQGPAGPQGVQGIQGVQGVPGPAGANGAAGPAGPAGAAGPTGTFSETGNWSASTAYSIGQIVYCAACSTSGSSYIALTANVNMDPPTQTAAWGLVAHAGTTGATGPQGIQGAQGIPGPVGPTGPTGAIGPAGAMGAAGATGPTGPAGPTGLTGPAGPTGATGATGATGTLSAVTNWSASTAYSVGQVVYCAVCSTNGSSYIALAGNTNIDPPTNLNTIWQLIAQAGATGPAGPTGATGAIGPQGPTGATGPQGNPGVNGTNGTNGTGSVTSVTVGSVSNTAAAGAGTLTLANTTTTPTISINFPASSANSGFTFVANILSPGDTNTDYVVPLGGVYNVSSVSGGGDIYVPSSCTVSSLNVRGLVVQTGSADSTTFVVQHNDVNTAMTCTVNTSNVLGNSGTCSDTTHTFNVTAGDFIDFQVAQTSDVPYINYSTELVCH